MNQQFVQSQTIQLLQASCSKWEMKSSTGNSVLVTSDYNNQYTCMQIVHQLECVHLFVPCGNEPGQKSFRHLQMYFFRSNGGIRKTKKSSMSLHSFMQSRRSRARRRIWQRGSSAAAASSTLLPLIRTHSFHSISGSFPLEHHKKGIQGNSEEDQNCVPHLGCSHLILQLSVFRIQ